MKKINWNIIGFCLMLLLVISCAKEKPLINNNEDPIPSFTEEVIDSPRYFDSVNGNDVNDGQSTTTPWKSLERLNYIEWKAGAVIYLKTGSEWEGQFELSGSGSSSQPIQLTSYGGGAAPVINGTGKNYTLKLENRQYWLIENLEITNFNDTEEGTSLSDWENHNKSYWAEGTELPQYEENRSEKSAILVLAEDAGELNRLHFKNLEIHGVNGDISEKNNGGIFMEITGDKTPTWFDDILIENCFIHDIDRTGVSNQSSWSTRSLNTNTNWTPSKNIIIRNNRFERTGANALIVRVADAPLVEYNVFDHCAIKESGNASFPFNCDNALWQYNEAMFTKYNEGDNDAGGFDSDYRCKNTTIRYNYSHDNEYGGILICCKGGTTRFNVGTRVCYNIFANNQRHVFRISGIPDETLIHNNVVYNADDRDHVEMIWHKNWSGYPSNTSYVNNIFFSREKIYEVDLSSSTGNLFEHNIFFGQFAGDLPANRMVDDPLFEGNNFTGTPAVDFFRIKGNSPAKNAGKQVDGFPEQDYFGNLIQDISSPDIGVHELN